MEKRCAKFIWSCFYSHNLIVRNISMTAKISSSSDFGDNYIYLSYKYGIANYQYMYNIYHYVNCINAWICTC